MTAVDSLMPSIARRVRLRWRHLLEEANVWAELGDTLAAVKLAPAPDPGPRTNEPYAVTTELLSVVQASKFLGVAISTLNKWRVVGNGA